jgi:hypothetical protein
MSTSPAPQPGARCRSPLPWGRLIWQCFSIIAHIRIVIRRELRPHGPSQVTASGEIQASRRHAPPVSRGSWSCLQWYRSVRHHYRPSSWPRCSAPILGFERGGHGFGLLREHFGVETVARGELLGPAADHAIHRTGMKPFRSTGFLRLFHLVFGERGGLGGGGLPLAARRAG